MKKIVSVVGARPNFMKIAPLERALKKYSGRVEHIIVHTGQHYDANMSKVFFDELGLPEPAYYLGIGSASHAVQTAKVMIEFEKVLLDEKPDLVVVVGDVNSTIACGLTAKKLGIPLAHVEAGLRSFDEAMPEEINRVLTDRISDLLYVTERSGLENLRNEGVEDKKVFFTGHVMIDSVVAYLPAIEKSDAVQRLGLHEGGYVLCTLHRPSNVDSRENLKQLVDLLNGAAGEMPLVFPIHPRTKARLEEHNLREKLSKNVLLTDPIGYIDFMALQKNAALVLTDSGGIQEESTWLGVQCVTVRANTERPVTVEVGTNHLAGTDYTKVLQTTLSILGGKRKRGSIPELWDGKAAERIAAHMVEFLENQDY